MSTSVRCLRPPIPAALRLPHRSLPLPLAQIHSAPRVSRPSNCHPPRAWSRSPILRL